MRRLLAMIVGVFIGGGLVFGAFQFHLVRTDSGYLLVKKQQATWRETHADIRGWKAKEWNLHRELARDLASAGHGEYVVRSGAENFLKDILGGLREKPLFNRSAGRRPQTE